MSRMIRRFKRLQTPCCNFLVRYVNTSEFKLTEKDVEEIKIPVPWGHIAGKWWGSKDVPPVLAIHGLQDNANSFDKLIPLLNVPSVLAIDLPGHGRSSYLPKGVFYDLWEAVVAIHRIKKHFKWKQIALLTHSYGATIAFVYSALFCDRVKWFVSIECVRTLFTLYKYIYCNIMSKSIDGFLKLEKEESALKPAYKMSKMIQTSIVRSLGSISTPEAALILLKRGTLVAEKAFERNVMSSGFLDNFILAETKLAKLVPKEEQEDVKKFISSFSETTKKGMENFRNFNFSEVDDKLYTFTRDPRLKIIIPHSCDEEYLVKTAECIKCPVLSIRAKNGFLFGTTRKLYEKTVDVLKKHSVYTEHHDIDGTHHVHLIQPENLARIINDFIKNHNS